MLKYRNMIDSYGTQDLRTIDNKIFSKIKGEIKDIHNKYNIKKITKMKSSYKFCVIASGEFDLYVADPRASEWDIAAGDAILRNAGGSVKDMDGTERLYGKKDFKNPSLVVKSARLLNNE